MLIKKDSYGQLRINLGALMYCWRLIKCQDLLKGHMHNLRTWRANGHVSIFNYAVNSCIKNWPLMRLFTLTLSQWRMYIHCPIQMALVQCLDLCWLEEATVHFESANITGLAINISLLLLLQHLFSSAYCLLLWVSVLCSWARRCASLLLLLQRHSLFDSGLFEPLSEVNFRLYLQQTECLSKCHCGLLKWSFANLSSYLLRLSRLHVRKHLTVVMNLSEDPYC